MTIVLPCSCRACPWNSPCGQWLGRNICFLGRCFSTSVTFNWTTRSGPTISKITTKTVPLFRCTSAKSPLTSLLAHWRQWMTGQAGRLAPVYSPLLGESWITMTTEPDITWPVGMLMVRLSIHYLVNWSIMLRYKHSIIWYSIWRL